MLEGAAPYVNLNRGKYMKFIRSNRYAGHQLSDDGPEWHQKFALVMKRALSVDPTERATVAEVLGIVEDMRVEDKEELKRRYLTL